MRIDQAPGGPDRRYRPRARGRRHRVEATFTDAELTVLTAAAAAGGLTPTGFVAEAALAAARGDRDGPGSDRETLRQLGRELMATRTAINRVRDSVDRLGRSDRGGERNGDVAGTVDACTRAVLRLDAVVARIRTVLR